MAKYLKQQYKCCKQANRDFINVSLTKISDLKEIAVLILLENKNANQNVFYKVTHSLFVKGRLVLGVGYYNRGISQSIKKGYLIFYFIMTNQIILSPNTMLLCSLYLRRKT